MRVHGSPEPGVGSMHVMGWPLWATHTPPSEHAQPAIAVPDPDPESDPEPEPEPEPEPSIDAHEPGGQLQVGSLGAHAQPVPRKWQSGFAVQSASSLPYAAHASPVSTGSEPDVLVELEQPASTHAMSADRRITSRLPRSPSRARASRGGARAGR